MNVHQNDIVPPAIVQTADNVTLLPIELTNATGTYLHQLHDYCLEEIFSCNSLAPMDLCSLANACKRFEPITQCVYRNSKFVISYGFRGYKFEWNNNRQYHQELRDVEQILMRFGPQLSTLSLQRWNEDFVNFIAMHCKDVPFKCLKIERLKNIQGIKCVRQVEGIRRSESTGVDVISGIECVYVKLESIFQRLLKLVINGCDLRMNVQSSYINCEALTELRITDSKGCGVILQNNFPNLRQFTFANSTCTGWDVVSTDDSNTQVLLNFIECHTGLRTLDLRRESVWCNRKLMNTIGNSCKELQNLTLRNLFCHETSSDLHRLPSLPKLTMLEIDVRFINYDLLTAVLQASTSLETLKCYFIGNIPDPKPFFRVLSQLKCLWDIFLHGCSPNYVTSLSDLIRLRKLCLSHAHGQFCATDLFNIMRKLTKLEEFTFKNQWNAEGPKLVLDEEDFCEIVQIVAGRMLRITCPFNFDLSKNYDENLNVKLEEPRDF